jgi:tetratricopeptide (TPR) repeat protein
MAQIMLRDYLQQAEDALSSARIDDALASCQHVLTHFPGSLEAQRLLGEIYLAQGHLEEAQQTFDWVLTSDPENVVAYCDRALISERLSDFDTALDCYQQAYELSRGNSQIRQEFNSLSTRVGQPDFMFSRAGLARLYMRGDLLAQAIQEWEVVLATTPDRLDARAGLLEAYWREEQFDRVEQLAKHILDENPSCLKALLLLAHTTAPRNLEHARELIKKAEALDPELVMAHDLFSDFMAREPNDPFLALLKKSPIALPDIANAQQVAAMTATPTLEPTATTANGTQTTAASMGPVSGWSSSDSNAGVQKSYEASQASPDYGIWSSSDIDRTGTSGPEFRETDHPTPPAWLEMLTQREQHEPGGAMLSLSAAPSIEQELPTAISPAIEPALDVSMTQIEMPRTSPLPHPPNLAAEDSDDMGWPEWLKSLGATTMDSEPPPQPMAQELEPIAEPRQEEQETLQWSNQAGESPVREMSPAWTEQVAERSIPQATPSWLDQLAAPLARETVSPWTEQVAEQPGQQALPVWLDQLAAPPDQQAQSTWMEQAVEQPIEQPLPLVEQRAITMLEDIQQNLHVQGFVELEPGSLSAIAHGAQEPTLSSALAQLGNLDASSSPQPAEPADTTPPVPPITELAVQPTQPLRTVTSNPLPMQAEDSNSGVSPQPHVILPNFADTLLDSELEMTMRHPAVRLQPMQPRQPIWRDQAPLTGKGYAGETVKESYNSERDRLLQGYHYQLAGDFDEAMQEYRAIIRSTPNLLDEVISNVRALLKLAPKYSAGYRVLGDAYMRKGEYLQAMEAYNKALTMNKRAKGGVS